MSKSYTAPDLDHSSTRRLTWTWPQQQEQDQQIPSNIDCYQTAPDQGFPIRLHYLLSQVDGDGDAHIVSWQPHGRCFVVHKQKEFVERILGSWFRQSKWASFQRQLNMYGFKRLNSGLDKGGYYHENFIRGEPHLARLINRQKRKGTGPRKPADIQNEPNFYAMDPIGSQQANVPQTDNATSPRVSSGAIGIARPPSLLDNTHASFQQCRKTCPLVVEHYNHGVQPHDHSLRSALGWPLLSSQIAPSPPRSYLMNGDDVCQHQKFVGQEDPVESRYLDPAKHYGASQLKQQHLLDEDIISCAFNFSDSFGSSGAV